jgi:hypothetical protein
METDSGITITRALAELKLLDKRITKGIRELKCAVIHTRLSKMNIDSFKNETLAEWQSINDLVTRREKMKTAIMNSNNVTSVKIGGKTYTIAEAIETKKSIGYRKTLLEHLKREFVALEQSKVQQDETIQRRIDSLLETEMGKDNKKTDPEAIEQLTKAIKTSNSYEVIDPIRLEEKIKLLTTEIDDFELNVDFVLSESNSRTKITIV